MIFNSDILQILERYADEVIESETRSRWVYCAYDGINMQERLAPLFCVWKEMV